MIFTMKFLLSFSFDVPALFTGVKSRRRRALDLDSDRPRRGDKIR